MRANSPSSAARFAVCLLVGTLASACDHATQKTSSRPDAGCTPGTELCSCLAGNACTGDLVCGSGLCVHLTGVTTGAGGSGGGGGDDGGGGVTTTGSGGSGEGQGGGGGGTTPGSNLVTNGDFSNGEMFWNVIINNGGNADHSVQGGALCVTVSMNQSVTLGWAADAGSPLQLQSGSMYQLSYRAQASTMLGTFTAKVGHAVPDYATDFQMDEQVGNGFSTFTHTFTTDHADDQTGIAFILQGAGQSSMVCVDDVTLTVAN